MEVVMSIKYRDKTIGEQGFLRAERRLSLWSAGRALVVLLTGRRDLS